MVGFNNRAKSAFCLSGAMAQLRSIVLFIAVVMLLSTARASSLGEGVALSLRVFSCSKDANVQPSLKVSDIKKTFAEVPVRATWTGSNGSWEARFDVPAGHYIVSSGLPHCSGETEQWVAIPGDVRHLAITMNKIKVATVDEDMYAGAIYGYLPTLVTRVEVMNADSAIGEQTRRSATVDGDTYQIGHLRSGDYVVRIVFGNIVASRAVHIPKDSYGPTVRADLTSGDALSLVQQQAAGSKFVPVPNFKKEPAETFRLGAASADGWTTEPLIPPSDYFTGTQRISAVVVGSFPIAARFLNSDPRIPPSFRELSQWSVGVWKNDDDIVLNLTPTDLVTWQKQPPKTPEQCFMFSGAHYVRLAINDRTWKLDESRVCP